MAKGGKPMKSIERIFAIIFINSWMLGAIMANDDVDAIGKSHPNDRFISYKATIIDTLEAERIFSERKVYLMEAYKKGEDRLQRCKELMGMPGKKVKEKSDLELLHSAFARYLVENPDQVIRTYAYIRHMVDSLHISGLGMKWAAKSVSIDKNVNKGKLSEDVMDFLSCYHRFLLDSLQKEHDKIEQGWNTWINKNELKYKEITISTKNPYYIGYNYYNPDTLDMLEKKQQSEGWEFLYSNNRWSKHDSYPQELNYYVYDVAPQYKVLYNENEIECVYDKDGELVYIPSFTREKNLIELTDIKRAVYYSDYQNNKYEIKSQPAKTQEYLKLVLGQENGFEKAGSTVLGTVYAAAFASMAASSLLSPLEAYKAQNKAKKKVVEEALKYKDSLGEKYIEQLREDHDAEFGYVYMIDRMSNVSFRIIYINKKSLQPSHCAIVTYRTGNKPYTKMFSVKLINEFPTNIPPAIP